jgi:hypothetical protein
MKKVNQPAKLRHSTDGNAKESIMSSLPPTKPPRQVFSRPSVRPTRPSMPDRPVVNRKPDMPTSPGGRIERLEVNRPATPPTQLSTKSVNVRPTTPAPIQVDTQVNRPASPPTNFSPMSSTSPSPSMPAPMKKGGYVSNGGKINLSSGRVSTAVKNKKSPNF